MAKVLYKHPWPVNAKFNVSIVISLATTLFVHHSRIADKINWWTFAYKIIPQTQKLDIRLHWIFISYNDLPKLHLENTDDYQILYWFSNDEDVMGLQN